MGDFLSARTSSKRSSPQKTNDLELETETRTRPKFKVYKAGPRDIGRNKDWKPANYGIDLKKMQSDSFLKERTGKAVKQEGLTKNARKDGPREIGRNKDWKPA